MEGNNRREGIKMTFQELYELVPSDTLQRDLEYIERTDQIPAGYNIRQVTLMLEYLERRREE